MAGHEAGWFGFCRDVRDCIYRISSFHRQCLVKIFENRRIQKLLFFIIQLFQPISDRPSFQHHAGNTIAINNSACWRPE
ncbi:hypothetical protein S101446_02128 [Komagataeibacter europaeus]|nr:hypothetical protein S101446_02128 [Komagataeibacter europaeus]